MESGPKKRGRGRKRRQYLEGQFIAEKILDERGGGKSREYLVNYFIDLKIQLKVKLILIKNKNLSRYSGLGILIKLGSWLAVFKILLNSLKNLKKIGRIGLIHLLKMSRK
jgi:hypothetical protein